MPETRSWLWPLLVAAGVLIVAFAALLYVEMRTIPQENSVRALDGSVVSAETYVKNESLLAHVAKLINTGRHKDAAAALVDVFDEEEVRDSLTAQQIYRARRDLLSKYRATGDPLDSLEAVRELKKTVLDERVPMSTRAESLTTLANSLCWFARSDGVIDAIFGEPPFDAYWQGDPTLANRDLLLLSYEEYEPTAKTAAALAYWYADQVILNDLVKTRLDPQTRAEFVTEAKRYIAESALLSDSEREKSVQRGGNYGRSARYIGYLYRRAFAIAALAAVGELPKDDYIKAYELFHSEADRSGSIVALQYTPFAYVLEAQFEKIFGASQDMVNAHLIAALRAIDSDPNPQSNEIVDFIRDKALDAEGRYSWHAIQNMRRQLPEFDAFVAAVEEAGRSE